MYAFSSAVRACPLGIPMPFLQAAPAAGCGGVLGDEDRVVSHRGLLAVVRGSAGASRSSMNFSPCDITVSSPLRSR